MHLLSPSSDSLWSWSDRKRSVFRWAKDLFRFHTATCQALGERAGCNWKRVKPNCWLQVLRKVVLQRGLGGDGQMVIDTNTRRADVSREGGFRYCCSQWGGERPAGPTRGKVVFKDWVKTCFGEGLASEGWCLGGDFFCNGILAAVLPRPGPHPGEQMAVRNFMLNSVFTSERRLLDFSLQREGEVGKGQGLVQPSPLVGVGLGWHN